MIPSRKMEVAAPTVVPCTSPQVQAVRPPKGSLGLKRVMSGTGMKPDLELAVEGKGNRCRQA